MMKRHPELRVMAEAQKLAGADARTGAGVRAVPAPPTLGVAPAGVQGPSSAAPRGLPDLGPAVHGLLRSGGATSGDMGGSR
jgi:hypothetical protein